MILDMAKLARDRAFVFLALFLCLMLTACKTNQGNGEAQPQNTGKGYNPDNEKNNTRKAGSGVGKETTPSTPAPAQTPSHPASKTDTSH